MPKRGQFGCQNCDMCGRSSMGEAGYKVARVVGDLSTGGMWRVARAFKHKCGVCGHLMKIHHPNPAAVVQGPASVVAIAGTSPQSQDGSASSSRSLVSGFQGAAVTEQVE